MNCDVRFCAYCDRPRPRMPRARWFRRRVVWRCECGAETLSGWGKVVQWRASSSRYTAPTSGVLEVRVPVLNPWAGAGVVALHSHTVDGPCDDRCSVHEADNVT